ncbi:putative aminoacyltransferase, E1 ubiquitin-activating enzyme [Lupinus albus]|uniref:RING-type E3 ubiquitin transferase n=1 Tax=Lupinus albus TaxID=3870 RepID=A0A6A4QII3_LUPAL|nr:putative aminoacyltransferase, E1 ubiquitin-activating enzyme [Lupinus albus]
MSSAGGGGNGGANAPRQYLCYQCNRTVSVTPSSDLVCPNCNSDFVEEVENPISQLRPSFSFAYELPYQSRGRSHSGNIEAFNPLVFLQNYIQSLRASGGNVRFAIENTPSGELYRIPTNLNLGDYFFGHGLEQLIQHLAENDPNSYGPPPASKTAVEGLPDILVNDELLDSDLTQCAVCKDTFELNEIVKKLPCKHFYHSDCILPWLELHNSCPMCRYELPTDDPDYEQRAQGEGEDGGGGGPQVNQNENAGDSSQLQSQSQSPRELGFRVLPWQFRQFAGDTSNVDTENDHDNNTGEESNIVSWEYRNFESEPREEDLD